MRIAEILVRLPVNRMAAIVTSQRRCVNADADLTTLELKEIVWMLRRKKHLLNLAIGVKNKSQHKNTKWKFNKGLAQYRQSNEPRVFAEYRLVGWQIQQIERELAKQKIERRLASTMKES